MSTFELLCCEFLDITLPRSRKRTLLKQMKELLLRGEE
jgi:hypothetical protein